MHHIPDHYNYKIYSRSIQQCSWWLIAMSAILLCNIHVSFRQVWYMIPRIIIMIKQWNIFVDIYLLLMWCRCVATLFIIYTFKYNKSWICVFLGVFCYMPQKLSTHVFCNLCLQYWIREMESYCITNNCNHSITFEV